MTITVNAKSYELDTYKSSDIAQYNGPAHTLAVKDLLTCKRTAPKPTSTSDGVGRAACKLTRSLTDGTDVVGDGILEVSVSFPVGSQASEQATMITDIATWAATASADSLLSDHDITQ